MSSMFSSSTTVKVLDTCATTTSSLSRSTTAITDTMCKPGSALTVASATAAHGAAHRGGKGVYKRALTPPRMRHHHQPGVHAARGDNASHRTRAATAGRGTCAWIREDNGRVDAVQLHVNAGAVGQTGGAVAQAELPCIARGTEAKGALPAVSNVAHW